MSDADNSERMAAAEAARAILSGNAPALRALEAELTKRLVAAAKQGRQDKATDLLGMSLKAIENIEAYFAAIVTDGDVARHAAERASDLGSGLIDHSQKMTVAASAMAEKNAVGQRS